ncbi:hypothetical protein GGTG_05556 [Gaeumannomyces tritici R3-111a-1]|uniref:BZIP domain-containing protein n=1 Tax=Gaeumannomyces tritici (strain R3-111a-1) TaxID=644352 RepID=J3NW91_GAET3|nr:hypothetical protein GGTG_05556 [Gaeumannomyces tritici R3-111a-1]EJT75623.1 hypothetical protein GGTG_05556 [Gaeumannomyces tritici R3-111a-1]
MLENLPLPTEFHGHIEWGTPEGSPPVSELASSSHTREGGQGGPGLAARPPSVRSLVSRISAITRKNKEGAERQQDKLREAQREVEQTKKENAMLKQQLEDAREQVYLTRTSSLPRHPAAAETSHSSLSPSPSAG